jgi:hypothetical protein
MNEIIMEIQTDIAASTSNAVRSYQNEQILVEEFDALLTFRKQNRLDLGKMARQLKKIHLERGERQKGKGWEAFLTDRGLNDRTVDRWIEAYEIASGLRGEKTVRDILSRTNNEDKEPILKDFDPSSQFEPDFRSASESTDAGMLREKPNLPIHMYHGEPVATAQERSNWLFRHALDVFGYANKASGQALREWDDAAARVRKVLASYKRDEVDNPNADFSPIAREDE